jgi:hypothetical protein
MSKVYSFRLSDDNPREAQAREVIEAWVGEGYSLRHVVVEALISFGNNDAGQSELNEIVEQLQDLILTLDKQPTVHPSNVKLQNSFLNAVKNSAKLGFSSE